MRRAWHTARLLLYGLALLLGRPWVGLPVIWALVALTNTRETLEHILAGLAILLPAWWLLGRLTPYLNPGPYVPPEAPPEPESPLPVVASTAEARASPDVSDIPERLDARLRAILGR